MAKVATNANFADMLQDDKLVIVDFWAVWCGPCRMLSPIVDEIAEEMADKVTVVKCNVDDCEDIAMQYRIMSIPTLIYFKDGQIAEQTMGVQPKESIAAMMK